MESSVPILHIRGTPVIIDSDLAKLYGVETRGLNQAIKRNAERFPEDSLFQLTAAVFVRLRSQIVTSNIRSAYKQENMNGCRRWRRCRPFVSIEKSTLIDSEVLNSIKVITDCDHLKKQKHETDGPCFVLKRFLGLACLHYKQRPYACVINFVLNLLNARESQEFNQV